MLDMEKFKLQPFIAALKEELRFVQMEYAKAPVEPALALDKIVVELAITASASTTVTGGFEFWVLKLGIGENATDTSCHTVRLELTPIQRRSTDEIDTDDNRMRLGKQTTPNRLDE